MKRFIIVASVIAVFAAAGIYAGGRAWVFDGATNTVIGQRISALHSTGDSVGLACLGDLSQCRVDDPRYDSYVDHEGAFAFLILWLRSPISGAKLDAIIRTSGSAPNIDPTKTYYVAYDARCRELFYLSAPPTGNLCDASAQ